MLVTGTLSDDDSLDPPNEEILNVIRESNKRGIGTSEIVEVVDLGADAVRDRLHGLAAGGRVESETIGSEDDYNFVWYLAEDERTQPVNPDIARLVDWCEHTKSIGETTLEAAKFIGLGGVVVIILTLSAVVEGFPLGGFDPTLLLYVGWATVLGAAGAGVGGGGLIYIAVVAEWFGEWLVERENDT
jgi:hypothetical protein